MSLFNPSSGGFDMVSYVLTRRRAEDKGLDTSEASRVALLASMIPGNPAMKIVIGDRIAEARAPDESADDGDGEDDTGTGEEENDGTKDDDIKTQVESVVMAPEMTELLFERFSPVIAEQRATALYKAIEPVEKRMGEIEKRLETIASGPATSGGSRTKRGSPPQG